MPLVRLNLLDASLRLPSANHGAESILTGRRTKSTKHVVGKIFGKHIEEALVLGCVAPGTIGKLSSGICHLLGKQETMVLESVFAHYLGKLKTAIALIRLCFKYMIHYPTPEANDC